MIKNNNLEEKNVTFFLSDGFSQTYLIQLVFG